MLEKTIIYNSYWVIICVHVPRLKEEDIWITAVKVHCELSLCLFFSSCVLPFHALPASCQLPESVWSTGCYTTADLHCKLHYKQIALKDIREWGQYTAKAREVVQMFQARPGAHWITFKVLVWHFGKYRAFANKLIKKENCHLGVF